MFSVNEIIDALKDMDIEYDFKGDPCFHFQGFCPLNNLKKDCITWARSIDNINFDELKKVQDVLIFVRFQEQIKEPINTIYVADPHKAFFKILQHFFSDKMNNNGDVLIAKTATVETEKFGVNLRVGNYSYIGPNVIIGNNVSIGHNVTIEGKVVIGDNCNIGSGSVIGANGFGHYKENTGESVCVPHLGGVKIGKHVDIGANNTISRGCLGDTIISDYVKTDNLCHIAHNVIIKDRVMITACAEISGSTIVEEDVWVGPASALNNSITIGRGSFLGIGTVATKSIPNDKVVAGVPAKILRDKK